MQAEGRKLLEVRLFRKHHLYALTFEQQAYSWAMNIPRRASFFSITKSAQFIV